MSSDDWADMVEAGPRERKKTRTSPAAVLAEARELLNERTADDGYWEAQTDFELAECVESLLALLETKP